MGSPHRLHQAGKFLVSTGVSGGMSFGLPVILHEAFGTAQNIAVAIGFATAYVGNIVLLKLFVFRSAGSWHRELARYVPVNGAFRLFEYGLFLVLSGYFGVVYWLSVLCVLGLTVGLKFFAYRFIFGDSPSEHSVASKL